MTSEYRIFENGIEIIIQEGYAFPHGDVYKGVVRVNGEDKLVAFPCLTKEECFARLKKALDSQIEKCMKEMDDLKSIKEKVDGIYEQV